jgi:hypothetical protein
MAYPRHVLSSVRLDAVTQVRASCDYHPGTAMSCSYPYCQFNVATSSLLLWALGLAPSKDNFWSTENQTGSRYGKDAKEPFSEMNSAILALSRGPVATGDKVGGSNKSVIMRTCGQDGRLLQPSRPATAIDANFMHAAFGALAAAGTAAGPIPTKRRNYPLLSTHSAINVTSSASSASSASSSTASTTETKWPHVLAILMNKSFALSPSMIPEDVTIAGATGAAALSMIQWTGYGTASNISLHGAFSDTQPMQIPACQAHDFQLWHASPVFSNGIAFLGEPSKWAAVSPGRVKSIDLTPTSVHVLCEGAPGEKIELAFATNTSVTMSGAGAAQVHAVSCTFPLSTVPMEGRDHANTALLRVAYPGGKCEPQ